MLTKKDKIYLSIISGLWLILSFIFRHAYYYNVDEFTYHTAIIAGNINSGLLLGRPIFILINHLIWLLLNLLGVDIFNSFYYLSVLQQLITLGAIIFFYLWIKKLWQSQELALLASVIAATNFAILFFSGSLLSEPLMHFWLFASLYFLAVYLTQNNKKYLYLASLLLGLSFLTKETVLVLLPLPLLQLWLYKKEKLNWVLMAKASLIFLATCLVGVTALYLYYQQEYLIAIKTSFANNPPLYHNFSWLTLKEKILNVYQIIYDGFTPIYILTTVIGLVVVWFRKRYNLLLLAIMLLTILPFIFIFGIPQGRLFTSAYFGAALLSAYLFYILLKKYQSPIAYSLIGLTVILALAASYTNFQKVDNYLHWRKNYAQGINQLEQQYRAQKPIFMLGRQNYIFNGPFNYDGRFKAITFGSAWDQNLLVEQISQVLNSNHIILYDPRQYSPTDQQTIKEIFNSLPSDLAKNIIIINNN